MSRAMTSTASPFYPVKDMGSGDSGDMGSSGSESSESNGSSHSGCDFPLPPQDIYYQRKREQQQQAQQGLTPKQPNMSGTPSPSIRSQQCATPLTRCASPAYSENWKSLVIEGKKEILKKQGDRRYDDQVKEDLDKLVTALAKAVEVRDSELVVVNQQFDEERKWRLELEEQLRSMRLEMSKTKERFNKYKVHDKLERNQSKEEDEERHRNEVELWEKAMEEIARMRVVMNQKDDKIAEFEGRCFHLQMKLDNQEAMYQRELQESQQKIRALSSLVQSGPNKKSLKQDKNSTNGSKQQQRNSKTIDLTRLGSDPAKFESLADSSSSQSNSENVPNDKGSLRKPRSHDDDSSGAGQPTLPFSSTDKANFPAVIQDDAMETEVVLKSNRSKVPGKTPGAKLAQKPKAPQGGQMQELQIEDALFYFESIKQEYSQEPNVYKDFLRIIKDYKNQTLSTPLVKERVCKLFSGKAKLILGFNQFLPDGYKISMEDVLRHQIASMAIGDDDDDNKADATSTSGDTSTIYDGDDEFEVPAAKSFSTMVSHLAKIEPGKIADKLRKEHQGANEEMESTMVSTTTPRSKREVKKNQRGYGEEKKSMIVSSTKPKNSREVKKEQRGDDEEMLSTSSTPRNNGEARDAVDDPDPFRHMPMTPPRVPLFHEDPGEGSEMVSTNNAKNSDKKQSKSLCLPICSPFDRCNQDKEKVEVSVKKDRGTTETKLGASGTNPAETVVTIHSATSASEEDVEVVIGNDQDDVVFLDDAEEEEEDSRMLLPDKYDVLEAGNPRGQDNDGDDDDSSSRSSLAEELGVYDRADRYDLQKMGARRRKMIIKELLEEARM